MSAPVLTGKWNYPTTIWSGPGRIAELPQACRSLGMKKPLLITDQGLAGSAMVKACIERNAAAGLPTGLFAGVKGNPTGANVEAGVAAYKAGGHDGVIAFGGGSGIDAAKAVALMAGQTRPLWDFEDVGDNSDRVNVAGMAPVVAVPTTSGTGSEVGRASVITNEDSHEKKIIFHPRMLPALVIADPELTVGLPPHITAATGVDAFVHCFEAYCAPGFHPMADGIALEGMRLIKQYLPRAYRDGTDIEARSRMLAAASMGAVAFQKGLGGVHALAHPIGAVYDTHHGLTNAVLLPYLMRHNRAAIAERMRLLAQVLDLPQQTFEAVFDWVLAFRKELGIPNSLADIRVPVDRAAEIGRMAEQDPSAGGNPIPVNAAALEAVFRKAVAGDLA
ncbi:iron-containing alcohol dehydrogenase [Ferrovibrio sp.]|uniref:iron-containing alcohol dehydrogenase n=1 Tax=Ferrovibrio sp. TaxID=1917215 RepID=UPI000CC2D86F|nr:iron-containing alcohol dehydrogenase [Ferrovibrio sp.]PJI40965.1 MAG: alcohol dehydrogenase [Ferrovibrio sp.]